MAISGRQKEVLSEAILSAFTETSLRRMLSFRLNKNLSHYVSGGTLPEEVFELIDAAEREGWTAELISAARQFVPGNRQVQVVAEELSIAAERIVATRGAAPSRLDGREFERIVTANSFLDVVQWRTRQAELEGRICQVQFASRRGRVSGTGFLVGPDAVITNFHVVEPLIQPDDGAQAGNRAKAADVVLLFDYKRLADGATLHRGTPCRLVESDWLMCSSPPSPVDAQIEPKTGLPRMDELDFALLRVEGSPGTERPAGPDGPARGWIEIPDDEYDFSFSEALFIMQHPKGAPMQLVLDTQADIKVNGNATRVTYRTNTLAGSSGSPCFSMNWELIALHHMGDPDFDPVHKPEYNQGIPIAAIRSFLAEQEVLGLLTSDGS